MLPAETCMKNVRRAEQSDVSRIAEIMVFNYRLNFYRFSRMTRSISAS